MHLARHPHRLLVPLLGLGLFAAACDSEPIREIIDNLGRGGNVGSGGAAGGADGGGGGAGGTTGGQACGGALDVACGRQAWCEYPTGACGAPDATGVCKTKPEVCDASYRPVCGCDGKTYGNDCARQGAGVSKQHDGECRVGVIEVGEGEQCGGFRLPPQRVCAKGFKCNDPPGRCGFQAVDGPGICEAVPTACTREYRPVCGCDGKTYGNDCTRKAAGVALDYPGECRSNGGRKEGEMCGGIAGFACDRGLFCEPAPGSCRVADVAGVCKPIPGACTKEYQPVCGCDGKTYGNDCTRQAAGVPKNHDGACR